MSQTIIDGIIPKAPKGWRKLRRSDRVRDGDRWWYENTSRWRRSERIGAREHMHYFYIRKL